MSVLGLSILIASVSFLCYRHPPSSWFILEWLRRPSLLSTSKKPIDDAPLDAPSPSNNTVAKDHTRNDDNDGAAESKPIPTPAPVTKEELDRKSMPPPAFKKPQPPTITKPASQPAAPLATQPPTFTLRGTDMVPSFPAANSAQRASGGARAPPRLPTLQPPPGLGTAGLLSPPPRSPLPNRGPPSSSASSSSLAPPPTHNSIPAKPRRKVLLTPGHSPLDWARLCSSPSVNLRGLQHPHPTSESRPVC